MGGVLDDLWLNHLELDSPIHCILKVRMYEVEMMIGDHPNIFFRFLARLLDVLENRHNIVDIETFFEFSDPRNKSLRYFAYGMRVKVLHILDCEHLSFELLQKKFPKFSEAIHPIGVFLGKTEGAAIKALAGKWKTVADSLRHEFGE